MQTSGTLKLVRLAGVGLGALMLSASTQCGGGDSSTCSTMVASALDGGTNAQLNALCDQINNQQAGGGGGGGGGGTDPGSGTEVPTKKEGGKLASMWISDFAQVMTPNDQGSLIGICGPQNRLFDLTSPQGQLSGGPLDCYGSKSPNCMDPTYGQDPLRGMHVRTFRFDYDMGNSHQIGVSVWRASIGQSPGYEPVALNGGNMGVNEVILDAPEKGPVLIEMDQIMSGQAIINMAKDKVYNPPSPDHIYLFMFRVIGPTQNNPQTNSVCGVYVTVGV